MESVLTSGLKLRHSKTAHKLDINNSDHLAFAAELIAEGKVIVAGFNGVFGIFGDADRIDVVDRIFDIKKRPKNQNLILVSPPEFLHEHINTDAIHLKEDDRFKKIILLYQKLHALGVILPAHPTSSPKHLVQNNTILNIWTEYLPNQPIRKLILHLRTHGKRSLVGTSANRTGEPTHSHPNFVYDDFKYHVDAILLDSFKHLPPSRRKSTSIIDFTTNVPLLHRSGNVSEKELNDQLQLLKLGTLKRKQNFISVKSREE